LVEVAGASAVSLTPSVKAGECGASCVPSASCLHAFGISPPRRLAVSLPEEELAAP